MSDSRNSEDAIELELHALRPRELPRALVRRIEADLTPDNARRPRSRLWIGIAAAGLAASIAIVVMASRRGSNPTPPDGKPIVRTTDPSSRPGGVVTGRPQPVVASLGAYRRAYAQSPEALDALLSRAAALTEGQNPAAEAIRAFKPHRAELDDSGLTPE
jgi:hypothetical protein